MINKSAANWVVCLFCLPITCLSQSILDSTSVHQFATYLERNQMYEFAAEEYERLYFYCPNNIYFFEKAIDNYRLAQKTDVLDAKMNNAKEISQPMVVSYVRALSKAARLSKASAYLKIKRDIIKDNIVFDRLVSDLDIMKGNYEGALKYTHESSTIDSAYLKLIYEGMEIPQKKPLLGGAMSAAIPGLGRVYARDFKDAAISFVLVAGSAYQSYRRFKSKGVNSAGGWIYGGIGLGLYLGNIYGSVQSVRRYNLRKKDKYNAKVNQYMDSFYSN